MNYYQSGFLFLFSAINLLSFFIGILKCKKNCSYTEVPFLFFSGTFVWGDALVFGPFWFFVSLFILVAQEWILFPLTFSVFWLVRSLGETIYWLNQQFSTLERNKPHRLIGYRFVKNDSVWYLYQIFWQCISVISAIASFYFLAVFLHLK